MFKTKIISAHTIESLEEQLNHYLSETPGKMLYNINFIQEKSGIFDVMVITND